MAVSEERPDVKPAPARAWWEGRIFGAALIFLAALPLLWPAIPPLVDLPGHMGSYHVALNLAGDPLLRRFYDFRWALIGNLGVDLLVMPLGPLGTEMATKIAILSIPVATVAGFLLIAREVHGRLPPTLAIAVPLAWAYPLHYGFVNFCLAVGWAFLGFGLWLRMTRLGQVRARAILFLAIAFLVWLAHAIGWVMLGAMIGVFELQRRLRGGDPVVRALGGAILACLPLLTPLIAMVLASSGRGMHPSGWFHVQTIAKWTAIVLRDRWIGFDLLCLAVVVAVIALAILRRFGLSIAPAAGWPALALFAMFIVAPQEIDGSSFVAARLLPYAIALALLAIDVDVARRRIAAVLAITFCIVRMAGETASLLIYDRAYQRTLAALDKVPRGDRLAVFAAQGCAASLSHWGSTRLQHLGGMALVRRDAFVNDQWAIPGLHLLRTHYPAAEPFTAEPSENVTLEPCDRVDVRDLPDALAKLPRAAFDHLWLIGVPADRRPATPWLRPVFANETSVLYAIEKDR